VQEIITKLRTDRLRMIVIISPPGMGKTQVAISVSHSLKIREPALSVIYVERLDKLTDICGEILDRLSNRPWSISEDLISQAKRRLSDLQEDAVIVLNNTEDVQGSEFDDFAKWLVKFAPKVQLLITTCEDLGFISEIHKVQLRPLDVNLSAELLRKLEVNCSEKQAKDLGVFHLLFHPWTATVMHLIANSYKDLATESSEDGYAEQAEMDYREALQLRGKLLCFHHDTARSHVFLSDVLVILGNFQSALEELNKALEIQQELLGPQHKITTDTVRKITDWLVKMECKDKAKKR